MEDSEPHSSGFLAGFRRIADTVLSTLQNRIELFAAELQEQRFWLISTLLWMGAALFFSGLAVILVTVTIVHLLPDRARPVVLILFCLVYIGLASITVVGLRKQLKERSPPMLDTIAELKKDVAWLRSRDSK